MSFGTISAPSINIRIRLCNRKSVILPTCNMGNLLLPHDLGWYWLLCGVSTPLQESIVRKREHAEDMRNLYTKAPCSPSPHIHTSPESPITAPEWERLMLKHFISYTCSGVSCLCMWKKGGRKDQQRSK